jgi:non-specific serine/threonine protein kinase/serine/threonine-protein kinase
MYSLAAAVCSQGNLAEAEALYRKYVEHAKDDVPPDVGPPVEDVMAHLAGTLIGQQKWADAETVLRDLAGRLRQKHQGEHPDTVMALNNLAHVLIYQNRFAEAVAILEKNVEPSRRLLGDTHLCTFSSLNNLAIALTELERLDEAEPILQELVELAPQVLGDGHPTTLDRLDHYAEVLSKLKKYAKAEPVWRKLAEIQSRSLGGENPETLDSRSSLAAVLAHQGKYADAEAEAEPVFEIARRTLPEGDRIRTTIQMIHGKCLLGLERFDEAEPVCLACYEELKARRGDQDGETRKALRIVIEMYDAWGNAEKAAKYRAILPSGDR